MPRSSLHAESPPEPEFTEDTLLRGRVTLYQPARGFRASLDPVLLAGFLAPPFGRVLDIGCGTGALGFLLMAADADASGVGVELQPRLASLARAGCDHNGFATRLEILEGDVRQMGLRLGTASFDLVAANPPYRPMGKGRYSPDEERARSNHEVTLTLREWLDVAARAVRPGGRVAAIYPSERHVELLAEMTARGLQPVRLRPVHAHAGREATRVMVEARSNVRAPLAVEPPLVVHGRDGQRFSAEVARMLGD
jgi:tRNA1(Val) A37 N6-methylase TrmN6